MRYIIIFITIIAFISCKSYSDLPTSDRETDWTIQRIPYEPKGKKGSPEEGIRYLTEGSYGSGIPYDFAKMGLRKTKDTIFNRSGINGTLPYMLNVSEAFNGAKVLSNNCFTCHASKIGDQVIVGLGDSFSDFRRSPTTMLKIMEMGLKMKYKKDDPAMQAYTNFGKSLRVIGPKATTNNFGVNPAFRIAEACANNRALESWEYRDTQHTELIDYAIASDVPPLWNVKKKNALYYNGLGRGDFTKLLMLAAFPGVSDSTEARLVNNNYHHVLAWLENLEPPKYPKVINSSRAAQGQIIFEKNCSKCHGTYGENEFYPNKLVSVDVVKTDPHYARYVSDSKLVKLYNKSWFALSYPTSYFVGNDGYMAPPLDGVWATAPYLHNGSVPDLETLLDSKKRPTYWNRSGDSNDYNYQKVGWNYTVKNKPKGKRTYDTTLSGYSNQGHYFGDDLTDNERGQLIEYLKTL